MKHHSSHRLLFWLVLLLLSGTTGWAQENLLRTREGTIAFKSNAPLEVIEASSTALEGIIDPAKGTFAFSAPIRSFQGFNSPLQREHFNENYLESDKYPRATFSGKIIEEIDFTRDGRFEVRAKGKLNVHGREQERIIRSTVDIKNGTIQVSSSFTVLLEEHDIAIPKIVYQKIAEEIQVTVAATFTRS